MSGFRFPQPRSLMGQMLLAVALALLVVQAIGAFLIYRAQRDGLESSTVNTATFRLIAHSRGFGPELRDNRDRMGHGHGNGDVSGQPQAPTDAHPARFPLPGMDERYRSRSNGLKGGPDRNRERDRMRMMARGDVHTPFGPLAPRSLPVEYSQTTPVQNGEVRDAKIEEKIQRLLSDQNFDVAEIAVVHRALRDDPMAVRETREWAKLRQKTQEELDERLDDHLLVVGVRQASDNAWRIARVRTPHAANLLLQPLIIQTLCMYLVLVGALALILRRITRPLAAMTRRLEQFAVTPETDGQLAPSGPEDMQRLILAHNAMESRIVAMLDEKDVMLGAIGHDLKTPLAALRVRIESVENDTERARMAATIEDIVRTLDDILSLARVGRPSDPRERTELSALVASVVEEYEDMGDPVELEDTQRIVLELRSTWLRRALRNLIDNALRYGQRARVSLHREDQRAVILIEDDGPGIPEGQFEDMMNAFTRGDPSRNSTTGGSGLGLALARAIADQHGGALILKNRTNAHGQITGLIVRLEIPIG